MGTALLLWTQGDTGTFGSPGIVNFGNAGTSFAGVHAQKQYTVYAPGVLFKTAVLADNLGTSRTAAVFINGSSGTEVVNLTDSTAGLYSNDINFDLIASSDLIDYVFTFTGSNPHYYWVRTLYQAASGHACFYTGASILISTASTTFYAQPYGRCNGAGTVENNVRTKCRTGGTYKNLQAYVGANPRTSTTTIKSRVNGSDGNMSFIIGAGSTGLQEDASNSDPLSAGDEWNASIALGAGTGTLAIRQFGCLIVTANGVGPQNDLFCNDSATVTRPASPSASYYFFTGRLISSATEGNQKIQHGFPVRTSRLRIYISAYTYGAAATLSLRRNGASASQSITINGSGFLEDTTGTDDFSPTDDVDFAIVGGSSGSISMEWAGITEIDLTPIGHSLIISQAVKRSYS